MTAPLPKESHEGTVLSTGVSKNPESGVAPVLIEKGFVKVETISRVRWPTPTWETEAGSGI